MNLWSLALSLTRAGSLPVAQFQSKLLPPESDCSSPSAALLPVSAVVAPFPLLESMTRMTPSASEDSGCPPHRTM